MPPNQSPISKMPDMLIPDDVALQATVNHADALAQALVSNSLDCIKILDTSGALLFMSENGKCAMDVDDFETLRGRPWAAGWPEDIAQMIPAHVAAASLGETRSFCGGAKTMKGVFKVWDVTVAPIYAPMDVADMRGARAITRLVGVSRDVTDLWSTGQRPTAVIAQIDRDAAKDMRQKVLNTVG